MTSLTISGPGNFVPMQALSFGTQDGAATAVDANNPLPVQPVLAASAVAALEGSSASAQIVGPVRPALGRPIWLTLSGSWAGSAQLLRSIDAGATKLPLTMAGASWGSFTANCNEAVAEETDAAATYYLQLTPASGAIAYRVAQ